MRPAAAKGHLEIEPSASSWKVYVMGLDQAFERSYRDVRRELSAQTELTAQSEQARRHAADRLEWQGAIVPESSPLAIQSSSESSQTAGGSPSAAPAGSLVPAVIQLGEFLFENLVNPVFGHEHGGYRDSQ